ncbi:MAG: alpha/beta fold hydrolase [Parachlamydiaceae bacterium]|nr:alpha/beta fold hydrolase [Parachlamydiaceae bacterium]
MDHISFSSDNTHWTSCILDIPQVIRTKLDNFATRLAFGNQLDRLDEMENGSGNDQQTSISLKRDSLFEHIKSVSTFEKFTLALTLVVRKINVIRNFIMRNYIHPVTLENDRYKNFQRQCQIGESINLYSKDHQQLDAKIIRGGELDEVRPIFVMCPGNGMSYENWLDLAQNIARSHKVDVLLYNSRGIGLSLGEPHHTDELVEDCKAAINYALDLCEDSTRVEVLGLSLGGGITATALHEIQKEEKFKEIGLYINVNSFPSIPGVLNGLADVPVWSGRIALGVLGLNPLNAGDALSEGKLASKTVVITAENDHIMKGNGRLSTYLNDKEEIAFHMTEKGYHSSCPWDVIDEHIQEFTINSSESKVSI